MASNDLTVLKARYGTALRLKKGQSIEIVNTHGTQVVDFWAINANDLSEAASMPHSRNAWYRMAPRIGDALVTNRRTPIVTLVADSSPGVHDTVIPCCDAKRNEQLGLAPDHRSCGQNFAEALAAIGITPPNPVPMPLNVFMNVPVQSNGTLGVVPPVSKPGDRVVFRAEMEIVVVMSACPHDLFPVNGADATPRDVAWRVV